MDTFVIDKNITKTVYKVSDFLSFQRSRSLVLSPNFQRRSVWKPAAKSYFIDTVIRGFPVPIIFLREQTNLTTLEPIREVVDGQQRLRTLITFIEPEILRDFDPKSDTFTIKKTHNAEFGGKSFKDLSTRIKKRILNYEISVHVLPSDTDDREILQIFARMNSTGVKLNPQELRNAEYYGEFKGLAYNLAYEQLNRWRDWGLFSEVEIARMAEVEETSDLIFTMFAGVHAKSQPALNKLYKDYEENFPYKDEVMNRFRAVMDKINETLGAELSSSAFSRKPLFHTLFTFYYQQMFSLDGELSKKKASPISNSKVREAVRTASERIQHGNLSDELRDVLRGATANVTSRRTRLRYLEDIFGSV